ncbi:DUF3990 domain-containing protein [Eggerthellaceae bacterium zg-887]|uniref:DUF3990 domain-containing protein n=1 Tax=Xiamenia xianingshaonis TaxID=2682776 RepID=UPI00140C2995|nr:DUF3990 domain-containing protein [Xiamenia xianingshaonis]NHM16067.1 DUF3990 domain-containing protein [Xiamenia xianingshaonis]
MRLYRGSTCIVRHPDVARSRRILDFSQGFYLTSFKEQAERWALRKGQFENRRSILNIYELDDDFSDLNVLEFPENDALWVDFVCQCRRSSSFTAYDLIIGGVADDRVYEAVNMYFRGLWDMDTTLKALRFYDENDQYCFITQAAADDKLAFLDSLEVTR